MYKFPEDIETIITNGSPMCKFTNGKCSNAGLKCNGITNGNGHIIRRGLNPVHTPQDIIWPDDPSKCTWHLGTTEKSPHTKDENKKPGGGILPNILHHIGHTPLVRLNKLPQAKEINCQVLGKCEFFNPGGSIKDRIALRMIEDAEGAGVLKPGGTIIEPTSGNTGIGLALAAAIKGYQCVIVLPEQNSYEKVAVLRGLGAKIVRTPDSAMIKSPESKTSVAWRLKEQIPNSVILDQFRNPANPLAHYDTTAEEILEQCGGHLDMIVMGAGTGGTTTGIGRKIKEKCPSCIVVGVDPLGSFLAEPEELNTHINTTHEVEGIGYLFVPTVLDRKIVDKWYKSNDKETMCTARALIKEEGLLCGGSSGAALSCAFKAIWDFGLAKKEHAKVVVILPDGVRNYMTKFLSDEWMIEKDLLPLKDQKWWWYKPVYSLNLEAPLTIHPNVSAEKAIKLMETKGIDQMLAVDKDGSPLGILTLASLQLSTRLGKTDPIETVLHKKFGKVGVDMNLGKLENVLEKYYYALVVDNQDDPTKPGKEIVCGIVTQLDLIYHVSQLEQKDGMETF